MNICFKSEADFNSRKSCCQLWQSLCSCFASVGWHVNKFKLLLSLGWLGLINYYCSFHTVGLFSTLTTCTFNTYTPHIFFLQDLHTPTFNNMLFKGYSSECTLFFPFTIHERCIWSISLRSKLIEKPRNKIFHVFQTWKLGVEQNSKGVGKEGEKPLLLPFATFFFHQV